MKRSNLRVRLIKVTCFLIGIFIIVGSTGKSWSDELMEKEAVRYFREGLEAQRSGKLDQALSAYMKSIHANPNYVQAYNNLGTAYAQKGDVSKAEELYNQAIAIDPYYPTALKNLALIYADRGDYEKFVDYWKRAAGLDINNPFIIDFKE